MSKRKKTRKPYNPVKVKTHYLNHYVKKLVIQAWDSDQREGFDGEYTCNMPFHVLEHAVKNEFRWNIELAVKWKDANGKHHKESDEVTTDEHVKINELHEFALAALEQVESRVNRKHVYDRGWIARIFTPEVKQRQAQELEQYEKHQMARKLEKELKAA